MGSARETLRDAVASLSEAEASKALEYIRRFRHDDPEREVAELLAGDATIRVPKTPRTPLPAVKPIRGKGTAASELLIRDRR